MKIVIEATPKEIAALTNEQQGRRDEKVSPVEINPLKVQREPGIVVPEGYALSLGATAKDGFKCE